LMGLKKLEERGFLREGVGKGPVLEKKVHILEVTRILLAPRLWTGSSCADIVLIDGNS